MDILSNIGIPKCAFAEKTVVITGSARGIGRKTAQMLSFLGANIVVVDRRVKMGNEAVKEIKAQGGNAIFIETELTHLDEIAAMMKKAKEEFGQIDYLVNNATRLYVGSLLDTSLEEWELTYKTNMMPAVATTKAVLPDMLENKSGAILNVISLEGLAYAAHYSVTKVGLRSFVLSLAAELGPDTGVSILGFAPGFVDTELVKEFVPSLAKYIGMNEEEFINQDHNPGYKGKMPVEHCASGLIHALFHASEYHGQIADPFLPLSQAGIIDTAQENAPEEVEKKTGIQIKNYVSEITQLNRDLEHRIKRRTEELVSANAKLEIARDAAIKANRAKGVFFAKMSHELRTPLNVIILASEVIAEDIEAEELDLPEINDVQVSAWGLYEQITSILDHSKIEAGKMDPRLENFSIRDLIYQEIERPIAILARDRGNAFKVVCDEKIDKMYADRTWIKTSLYNLLSNACKFTKKGTIELKVTFGDYQGKECLFFAVKDSGFGIAPEDVHNLFKAFSQIDHSKKSGAAPKAAGTGLGLVNVQTFCQKLGGDVGVESVLGEGTTFTMWVPIDVVVEKTEEDKLFEDSHIDVKAALEAKEEAEVEVPTVLIIDDNSQWREILLRFLAKEGIKTVCAANGKEGLRYARKIKPTAITLDVNMPIVDGWDVLAELKSDPDLVDIPVIMLTIEEERDVGFALGACEYLTKPVSKDRLLATIKKFCKDPSQEPILIVDDDQSTRKVLNKIISDIHSHTIEAENGKQALEAIIATKPQLILLDLVMPQMDGFELLEQLQKHRDWKDIPVIVITGKDISKLEKEKLNKSVANILQKDLYNKEELLCEVLKLVKNDPQETKEVEETV